jgi:MFS family permease
MRSASAPAPSAGCSSSTFGDRWGRKWVLVCTLLLMGLSTLAIGLVPTYAMAGGVVAGAAWSHGQLPGFGTTSAKPVPHVLLVGSLFACVSAYVAGASADRFGQRPSYLVITGLLVLLPAPSFLLLSTKSTFAIYVVIVVGVILAAEGAVGVPASYVPETFGSRYRYAGSRWAGSSPRSWAAGWRR